MQAFREKVSGKLSRFFADSPNSSSQQASPYSKEGYSSVNLEPQDDSPFDEFVDCSPVCRSKDFLKDKISEDHFSIGGNRGSEIFEEANGRPQTPQAPKKNPPINLTTDSSFISPELYEFFESCLPNIVKGCQWVLLYSTLKDGISLRTLIRKSADLPGPGLLIVGDKQGAVFGGLLDCPLRPTAKRKYQGTNQTFVFTTVYGQPRLFRPTGANRYFCMCLNDSLALGGGGNFALCVDGDLLNGTSGPCETFGNSCLAHGTEFELKNVELWGFTHTSYLMQG